MITLSRLERQGKPAPTIYAEQAYGTALTLGSDRSWRVITDSSNLWRVPIVLSNIPDGGLEASSPYGYSGIYADSSLSADQVADYWHHSLQLLRNSGVVSLFLRFPPFEYPGLGTEYFRDLSNLALHPVAKTIEVATPDPDSVWSNMSGRARTAVRKAFKCGMTGKVCRASEINIGSGSAFRLLYESTMGRVGAAGEHLYDDLYYSTLLSLLGDRVFVVSVITSEGQPAASAIIMLDDTVVHYHLSGSDPQAARNGANNLLVWTILDWSAKQGFRLVHLGGGLSVDDSLFRFKSSFGGVSKDFWVGRAIIDQVRYSQLETMRAQSLGVTVSQLESRGFFPTFRA